MQTSIKGLVAVALLICPVLASAEEAAEPDKLSITGYIDASYNHLSGSGRFANPDGTAGGFNRVFDRRRNSGILHNVDLTAAFLPKQGFGGMVNLNYGDDADVFGAADTDLTDRYDVQAAHFYFADGGLTTIAGKYVTLAGAEVIKSPNDVNFSRSILFGYAIPFTHTGVRFSYALTDKVALYAGVNNGWDVFEDNNQHETLELAASLALSDAFTLFVDGYSGKEAGSTGIDGTRNLLDIVATYNATDKLSLVLNADIASQEDAIAAGTDASWWGAAGYVNYKFTDQWRVSLRGEYFDDDDGYRTGVIQKWKETTLTLAYLPTDSLELRGEVRRDWSNVNAFLDTDGSIDDSQYSVGLEVLYKFGLN